MNAHERDGMCSIKTQSSFLASAWFSEAHTADVACWVTGCNGAGGGGITLLDDGAKISRSCDDSLLESDWTPMGWAEEDVRWRRAGEFRAAALKTGLRFVPCMLCAFSSSIAIFLEVAGC